MWHLPTSASEMLRVQAWAISLGWHTLEEKQNDPFPLSKLEHYGCDSTSASARNLSSLIEKYTLFHTRPVCSFNTCFKRVSHKLRIWFVLCTYIKFRDSCIMYYAYTYGRNFIQLLQQACKLDVAMRIPQMWKLKHRGGLPKISDCVGGKREGRLNPGKPGPIGHWVLSGLSNSLVQRLCKLLQLMGLAIAPCHSENAQQIGTKPD